MKLRYWLEVNTTNDSLFPYSLSSPFGLHPPDGYDQHLKENNPRDYQDDSFHTLRRRHTYYQDLLAKENESGARATKLLMPKLSGGRKQLNVRLRARQVLCQSCRNVCNEKGEKVQTSSTHKTRQQQAQQKRNQRRSQQKQVEMTDALTNRKLTLVPKLKRLPPSEIEKYSDRSSDEGPATPDKKVLSATVKDGPSELRKQPLRIKLSNIQNAASVSGSSSGSSETTGVELRTLRKKRSAVGSMEDLWDETIFEEPSGSKESGGLGVNLVKSGGVEDSKSASQLATPVLKISFGKKKEVHRIPAKLHQVDEESTFPRIEDESGNNLNNLETVENDENLLRQTEAAKKNKLAQEKAARKAVKRAKKEAQRRQASHSGSSPGEMGLFYWILDLKQMCQNEFHFGTCPNKKIS